MAICELPEEVKCAIRSGINIGSTSQCITELILNSIDACATSIAVRVDLRYFILKIIDNGVGVPIDELDKVGTRYMTSKCHSLQDLQNNLKNFGFRGEALASLRKLSGVLKIETRPMGCSETYCKVFCHDMSHAAAVSKGQRPSCGTTVSISDFMYNMPVRRKRIQESLDLEEIKHEMECIALMHPEISFSLRNDVNGNIVMQTKKYSDVIQVFSNLFGETLAKCLRPVYSEFGKFKVTGYIGVEAYSQKNRQFIYVNKRLVLKTKLHKLVNAMLAKTCILRSNGPWQDAPISKAATARRFLAFPSPDKRDKFAVFVLNVDCTYSDYDICLEPKKSLIEFRDWDSVLQCVEEAIRMFLESESLTAVDKDIKNNIESNINEISVIKEIDDLAKESALNYKSVILNEKEDHGDINKRIGQKLVNVEGAVHGLAAKRKQESTLLDEVDDVFVRKCSSSEKFKITKHDLNFTALTEDPFHSVKVLNKKPSEKLFKITLSQPLFSSSAVACTKSSLMKEMDGIKKRSAPEKLKLFAFSPEKKLKLSNAKCQNECIQETEDGKSEHCTNTDKSVHFTDPENCNDLVINQEVNKNYCCVSVQVGSPLNCCSVGTSTDLDENFEIILTAKPNKFNYKNCYQDTDSISSPFIKNNDSVDLSPGVSDVSCQTSFLNSCCRNVVSQGTDCTDLSIYVQNNKSSAVNTDYNKESGRNLAKSSGKNFKLNCNRLKQQTKSQTTMKHVTFQIHPTLLTENKTLTKQFSYKSSLGCSDKQLVSTTGLHEICFPAIDTCKMAQKKVMTTENMLTATNLHSPNHTVSDRNADLERNVNNAASLNFRKKENILDEYSCKFKKTNSSYSQSEFLSNSLGYSSFKDNKAKVEDKEMSQNFSDSVSSHSDFHVSSIESPAIKEANLEVCNRAVNLDICKGTKFQFSDIFTAEHRSENVLPEIFRNDDIHKFENSHSPVKNTQDIISSATTVNLETQKDVFTESENIKSPIFQLSGPNSETTINNVLSCNLIFKPYSSSKIAAKKVLNHDCASFKLLSLSDYSSPYFNISRNSSNVPKNNECYSLFERNLESPTSCSLFKTSVSFFPESAKTKETIFKKDNLMKLHDTQVLPGANSSFLHDSESVLKTQPVIDSQIETNDYKGLSPQYFNTCGSNTTQELVEIFDNVMNNLVDSDVKSPNCTSYLSTQEYTCNKFLVNDQNLCKVNNCDSDCVNTTHSNQLWRTAYDDKGRVFYIHKSGITSYESPVLSQDNVTFSVSERHEFLPKGMSPIMEGTTLNLPKLSQSSLQKIDSVVSSNTFNQTDDGITVKWRNKSNSQGTGVEDIVTSVYNSFNLVKKYCEPDVPNAEMPDKFTIEVNNVMFRYNFTKDMFSHIKILGQLDKKFIVAVFGIHSNNDSDRMGCMLLLFDQHAVHERIRLETLMKEYCFDVDCSKFKYADLREKVLLPVDAKDARILSSFHEEFNRLGLYYNLLSDTEIEVLKIPTCLHNRFVREGAKGLSVLKKNLESLIREHVDVLLNTRGVGSRVPNTLHNIISSEACRGAIKFGDELTVYDSQELLKSLSKCDCPFQCAHGRPSLVPIADLDSLRKRQAKVSRKPQLRKLKTF